MALTPTPSPLAFGNQPVGQKNSLTVSIENDDADTDVTLSIAGSGFAVKSPADCVAKKGATTPFVIEYTPPGAAAHTGQLKNGGATVVALSGTGVVAAVVDAVDDDDSGDTIDADEINRYRIYVPTTEASLIMGRGHESMTLKAGSNAIDGFGLQTTGSVFLHAQGSGADTGIVFARSTRSATIWCDGTGPSTGTAGHLLLYQANADGKAIVTSKGGTYITGDAGVVIDGGLDLLFETAGDGAVIDPKPDTSRIDSFTLAFSVADISLAALLGVDAAVAAAQGFRPHKGKWAAGSAILASAGGFAGAAVGISGAVGALAGTTIYGHAGVSLLSPGYTAIYGLPGVGIFSGFPTMLGLIDTTVMGMHDVAVRSITGTSSMTGMKIGLEAWKDITIDSSGFKKAKGGKLNMTGGKITVGTASKPPTKEILLQTDDADTNLKIHSTQKFISAKAGGFVKLKAGDHYVDVSKNKKAVFMGTNAGAQIDIQEKKIVLYADELEWKDNAGGKLTSGPGGLKITGSKISLN